MKKWTIFEFVFVLGVFSVGKTIIVNAAPDSLPLHSTHFFSVPPHNQYPYTNRLTNLLTTRALKCEGERKEEKEIGEEIAPAFPFRLQALTLGPFSRSGVHNSQLLKKILWR